MPFCPSCGKEVAASDKFCVHCGKAIAKSANSSTSQLVSPNQQNTPTHAYQTVSTYEITCPSCGRKSDSIKRYTMFHSCLYLGCYIKWQMVTYTCCPDCMRKKILEEGIFTSKILTANIFWLFIILPWAIIQLFLCGQKGHSKGIE